MAEICIVITRLNLRYKTSLLGQRLTLKLGNINLLGALLILPLAFVIIFHLLKFVTYIVYFILGGILSFMKREKSALSRLLGAALGAVQGLVIFAVLMVPISGYVATVADLKAPLTAEEMPPELYSDVYKNGIYIAGGGALIKGLDLRLSRKSGIQVHIAEDPLRAVARGTSIALKNINNFSFLMGSKQ